MRLPTPLLVPCLTACSGPASEDTNSHTGLEESGADSGGSDTADPEDWVVLPASCEPPSDLPADPIALTGQVQITQTMPGEYFMELLDLEVDGGIVYGVGQGGLLAFDVSDPARPFELGHFQGPGRFHRVERLTADRVAVSHRDIGLVIVDTSDPSSMVHVARIDAPGWEGLAKSGDHLFVTQSGMGLITLDVTNPSAPVEVGMAPGLAAPWSLSRVIDGWMFAADNTLGIVPIDVSNPESPVIYDGVTVDGAAVLHVTWDGSIAYASAGGAGLVVFDVSRPEAPVEVARLKLGGSAVMSALSDDTLFIVDHDGLSAVDVSDPTAPRWIGEQTTPQFALAVTAVEERAWVGDWSILSGWDVDATAEAGELVVPAQRIVLPEEGGRQMLTLYNHGGGELVLAGAEAMSDEVTVSFSTDRIPSGGSATIAVDYAPTGATLTSELCIASSDPDGARRPIALTSGVEIPPIGDLAPDFSLVDMDGVSHRLSEQLGKPVLLAYFATW